VTTLEFSSPRKDPPRAPIIFAVEPCTVRPASHAAASTPSVLRVSQQRAVVALERCCTAMHNCLMLRIVTFRDFGWRVAHATVSPRPPISLTRYCSPH
jgi:hypothetical protein